MGRRTTTISLWFALVLLLSCLSLLGQAQRQRIDGGANSRSQPQQQFPQRYIPSPQKVAAASASSAQLAKQLVQEQQQQLYYAQAQQQQQPQQPQQQYYNYNGYSNGDSSQQLQYLPQSTQQSGQGQQQYQYYQPYSQQQQQQGQQYVPSTGNSQTEYSPQQFYTYGVQQQPIGVASQGAGGQYGQAQPIPLSSSSAGSQFSSLTGASSSSNSNLLSTGTGQYGAGGAQQQGGSLQPQLPGVTTPSPLTLPPPPPTLATLVPSLFPTPPPPPVYDQTAHMRYSNQPYQYNFDFAPGTPVIYCAYGANPIPVYNTPYKKCIPYHPLCGITFTCIFDVDPQSGNVWGHAQGTRKK